MTCKELTALIAIEFDEPAEDPLWKRWRRDCTTDLERIKQEVADGTTPEIKDLYKRKSIKDKYYFGKEGSFRGKCAYCETYLKDFQNPDIEHYRPKLGVTDENDVPIKVDYGNGEVDHMGYYWLAYDWRNLLPSCAKCNQASTIEGEKIGKHNRFPVDGHYALREGEIDQEQPLLLNPIVDQPERYIRVNTEDGALEAIHDSDRANTTIRVLGLNVRDQLRQRREGKIMEVKALLAEVIHRRERRGTAIKKLIAMRDGNGEYTAPVRAVINELAPIFNGLI